LRAEHKKWDRGNTCADRVPFSVETKARRFAKNRGGTNEGLRRTSKDTVKRENYRPIYKLFTKKKKVVENFGGRATDMEKGGGGLVNEQQGYRQCMARRGKQEHTKTNTAKRHGGQKKSKSSQYAPLP